MSIKYTILYGYSRADLIRDVEGHLATGWKLEGGVTCTISSFRIKVNCGDDQVTGWLWGQAMTMTVVE